MFGVSPALALEIIRCESDFAPYAVNYNKNSQDYSFWQINSGWNEFLYSRGFNPYDPDSNLEAGFYLLSLYGTTPWNASKSCWAGAT